MNDNAKDRQPMNRVISAVIAGLVTFGGIYGLAASLNLTTDSLGAANTVVAACQTGAMNATYTSTYSATVPGYTVGTVTVTGLSSGCFNKAYKVTLATTANAVLGEATGTTPSTGSSFSATFSPTVSAAAVTSIAVVISG